MIPVYMDVLSSVVDKIQIIRSAVCRSKQARKWSTPVAAYATARDISMNKRGDFRKSGSQIRESKSQVSVQDSTDIRGTNHMLKADNAASLEVTRRLDTAPTITRLDRTRPEVNYQRTSLIQFLRRCHLVMES